MRSLSQRASTALAAICVTFVVLIAATGIIGIAGVNSATRGGNSIAGDELTTSTTSAQLIQSMDAVYVAGEEALGSSSPVIRLAMTTSLYFSLLPTVDAQLETLERLHALDTAAEFKDIQLFARQWKTVRSLLSP